MRTLRFIVDGQIIKQDPNCDFDGLVPGSEGYLVAEFEFSHEWDGCAVVAAFHSLTGKEYPPQVLTYGRKCIIPTAALEKRAFKISVIGKRDSYKITTNKLTVSQNGGKE
jgi:hypothetical protein